MKNALQLFNNPPFVNDATGEKFPNDTGWQDRHLAAIRHPKPKEAPLVNAIRSWLAYGADYAERYELPMDTYAGDAWATWGRSLRALLNMDHGTRLDSGTLDGAIVDALKEAGIKTE